MRHIFGFFVCFLALNHFFMKVAMQRAAGDPEELFLSRSLTSRCNIIQQAFWVEVEGRAAEEGTWPTSGLPTPVSCYLLEFQFFWGRDGLFVLYWYSPWHSTALLCTWALWLLRLWDQWHPDSIEGYWSLPQARFFGGCTPDAHQMGTSRWALRRPEDEVSRVSLSVPRHESVETCLHATWHMHLPCFPERTVGRGPGFSIYANTWQIGDKKALSIQDSLKG